MCIVYSGIFRENYRKVPCITALDGARVELIDCKLKGDTMNDANTTGVCSIGADLKIKNSIFTSFKSGGIMI